MQKVDVRFASRGDPSLLVWRIAGEFSNTNAELQAFCLPIMGRDGGMLLAVPQNVLNDTALFAAAMNEDDSLLGPSQEFQAEVVIENEEGAELGTGDRQDFLVVDVADAVLGHLREYDPVTDSLESIVRYVAGKPEALVAVGDVLPDVANWLENITGDQGRLNFYSAREEPEPLPVPKKKAQAKKVTTAMLAEQMQVMMAQIQVLTTEQEALTKGHPRDPHAAEVVAGPTLGAATAKLPALSAGLPLPQPGAAKKALSLVGPPPKTKVHAAVGSAPGAAIGSPAQEIQLVHQEEGSSSVIAAISQQSAALTSLVAHLTSGDALLDLQGSSSSTSVSTKGVARREKMQQELAGRTSQYFLQVHQQIFKKMYPAKLCPKSEEDLIRANVSMTSYLEKYGAFKGQKELGLVSWMVAHAMDAAAQGDFYATKEFLALLSAALDQATLDGNRHLAYIVGLLEEPPSQMFAEKMQSSLTLGRPFAPLVPPSWAAVSLSYIKEIDLLTSKKTEVRPKASAAKAEGDSPTASPKRRQRFPKRPKPGGVNKDN